MAIGESGEPKVSSGGGDNDIFWQYNSKLFCVMLTDKRAA
jgi:hypothetical protein